MGPTKQVLSRWLAEAQDVMGRQSNMMNDMKEMIELLKTEALADKEKVIKFQDKLMEFKDEQLRSLKSRQQSRRRYRTLCRRRSNPIV